MKNIQKQFALFLLTFMVCLIPLNGTPDSSTDQPVKNIETFARLYGYVKYFYPGDEAAGLDWDRFAVYGVKKVEKAKNNTELKQTLEELFLPIAPALVLHDSGQQTTFPMSTITPPDKEGMKVVTWQHLGIGFGKKPSIYKSIRLNRKYESVFPAVFGNITTYFDAAPYRGKEIKFKAAVKIAKGKGQLWLRVDRPEGKRGFFDNMENRPIQSTDWNHYEITGKVADDATQIVFGCLLVGAGKLWVDDFRFYVKEGDRWKPVPLKNPGFEGDKEGSLPTVWATVRQHYSYRVTSETASEGSKSTLMESAPLPDTRELFERKAAFGEKISKKLGCGLSCILPIALYGTDKQTFPPAPKKELNRLTTAMEKEVPKELSGNLLYVRLADIVISWNVFQHFYPYFDVVKTDWRASLPEALKSAYRDKTELDFIKTLQKFTAGLKDGHVYVRLAEKIKPLYLPLIWEWIEEQLVVTEIYDKTLTRVRVGDIVQAIDGIKAGDALARVKPYNSAAANGWKMKRSLDALRRRITDSEVTLKLLREKGGKVEVHIKPVPRDIYLKMYENREGVTSKKIKEGIYYLDIRRIMGSDVKRLIPELQKARCIICDLRGYPREISLIGHLLKEKETANWMWIPQVIYPDYEKVTYRKRGWYLVPRTPRLTAHIIFLTDGSAISFAESYMGYIEHHRLATIVGQPTAGTNGNVNPFTLPGGYLVSWTGMRVLKHDGSQFHGVGIIPHVRMERTIKGIRQGRDEFLEKALEIAERKLGICL